MLKRDEYDILTPSGGGGWPPPEGPAEPPVPGTEPYPPPEGGEPPEHEGEPGDGESPNFDNEGEINGDVKVKKIGTGTIGDVLDPGKLKEIADELTGDELDKEIKGSFDGGEDGGDAETEWDKRVRRAVDRVPRSGKSPFGSVGVERAVKDSIRPRVDWKSELRRFVAKIFGDSTYKLPNRRMIHKDIYTWGIKQKPTNYKDVVICVDTSSSMDGENLNLVASEIKKLAVSNKMENIYIIYCDDSIKGEIELYKSSRDFHIKKMKPIGGGGTSFIPPFDWISKNVPNPAFVIYFTDTGGLAPEANDKIVRNYKDRVLWIVTDLSTQDQVKHLNFGKKILVDAKDFN